MASPRRDMPVTQGVHVSGPVPLERLVIDVTEGERSYSEEIMEAAEQHWEDALRKRPKMFNGPLWCLLSYEACEADGKQELRCKFQRSSFKYMLYTHMTDAGKALPAEARAGACGLMALTETADGFLVFGRRSRSLAAMPGYWHCVPAGQVDIPEPPKVLQKELLEETGFSWDVVRESSLLALMDCGAEQGHKYEFVFWLRLGVTAAQVHEKFKSAEDRAEHEALIFVAVAPDSASKALTAVSEDPTKPSETSEVAVPTVSISNFLGGEYVLTDIARRSLQLFCESRELALEL
mmetsp:Transcript_55574/g.96542  ORF Transcript_55574/g.96542 Transcript_55574/m.96542 type:complete len:293 (+) Transcript_55574:55-933(+)